MTPKSTADLIVRRSILLRLLVLVLFVVGAVVGLATAALAYSYQSGGCDGRDAMFYTFQQGPWNSDREDWFESGASAWDEIRAPGGAPFTSSGGGGVIDIHIDELPVTTVGRTNCGWFGDLVSIVIADRDSVINSQAKFTSVAMHEVGHSHGLGHAGDQDAVPAPLMRCSVYAGQSITGDDAASLGAVFSTASAHANPSFENGIAYWVGAAGSNLSPRSGGAAKGSDYALLAGAQGGYVFQSVRIVKVTDTADNQHDLGLRASVEYRKLAASTGSISVEIWAQKYNYHVSEANGCRYSKVSDDTDDGPVHLDDDDSAGPGKVGAFELKKQMTIQPSNQNAWELSTAAWSGFRTWDGGRIELRVVNNTTGGVDLDMLRARYYKP